MVIRSRASMMSPTALMVTRRLGGGGVGAGRAVGGGSGGWAASGVDVASGVGSYEAWVAPPQAAHSSMRASRAQHRARRVWKVVTPYRTAKQARELIRTC